MNFKINEVPRDTILKMVKREQEIRYSRNIQLLYDTIGNDIVKFNENDVLKRYIQKLVLDEHGYSFDDDDINEYMKICFVYKDDQEIKNSVYYMRLNIMDFGTLEVNDPYVDVTICDMNKNEVQLSSLLGEKPTVIIAGSIT